MSFKSKKNIKKIRHSLKDIILLTIQTFNEQKIGYQGVALSFFCTMAVVPFLAVAMAITKGFNLSDKLEALLFDYFPNNPDIVTSLMGYADNMLVKASSSLLGLVSAIFFVWLVIWMMLSVESVFNNVWKVKKGRSFNTRFWRDVAIVFISPFLMLVLYGGMIFLSGVLKLSIVKWLLMIISSVAVFSAMYKFIPNTYVKYKYAVLAAIISVHSHTVRLCGEPDFPDQAQRHLRSHCRHSLLHVLAELQLVGDTFRSRIVLCSADRGIFL